MSSFPYPPQTPPPFFINPPVTNAPFPSPTRMTSTLQSHPQQSHPQSQPTYQPTSCPRVQVDEWTQGGVEGMETDEPEQTTYHETVDRQSGETMPQWPHQQLLQGCGQFPPPAPSQPYPQLPPMCSTHTFPSAGQHQHQQPWGLRSQQQHYMSQPTNAPLPSFQQPFPSLHPNNEPPSHPPESQLPAYGFPLPSRQPHLHGHDGPEPRMEEPRQSQSQSQAGAQFCILASAAQKAAVEVMVRDMGDVGFH